MIQVNIEITKTRIDFYQYVLENTDWTHEDIIQNVSHRKFNAQKRKMLRTLLMRYVKEDFKDLDVYIGLDITEFETIFPPSAGVRPFKLMFRFEDKHHINKLKLKYPEKMAMITGNM